MCFGYTFQQRKRLANFEDVKILFHGNNHNKRIFLESLAIYKQNLDTNEELVLAL